MGDITRFWGISRDLAKADRPCSVLLGDIPGKACNVPGIPT
jgi:hypothetical protein